MRARVRPKTWASAVVVLAFLFVTGTARAQIGPGPFAAFPSQSTTDARFLGFGCAGIATFESPVSLTMAVPADQTSFAINVFDGDTGQPDTAGKAHWDVGVRQLSYKLYADPLRQGITSPANLVGSWGGNALNPLSGPQWSASAAKMPDNDWWAVTITTSPQAQAPSGNYFYILEIGLDGSCALGEQTEANIKIAASNPLSFLVPRFGLVAALRQTLNDGPIVYPGPFPPPGSDFVHAPTTYDGTFEFFFRIPGAETDLKIYDGDFDHGSAVVTGLPSGTVLSPCLDSNDPDTPFNYSGFPFSVGGATPEGVNTPGSPADDTNLDIFRRGEPGSAGRVGCVRYQVTDPLGQVYRDDNPSGSFEWEQFRIASPNAFDPNNSDYVTSTATLPSGIWSVKTIGLDLDNLNFFYANACATRIQGGTVNAACPQISAYLLGDTVWLDKNGNGLQNTGEPGIPGVKINLLDPDSLLPVETVVTGDSSQPNWIACTLHNTGLDTQGLFCHGTDLPGDYLLQIAPENFQSGGALAGLVSTTGGESQTHTVVDANVLVYDYGYRGNASIGDRIWLDLDANGTQDLGEGGLNGVTVELLDGGGNAITSTTTSGNGNYTFDHLLPGSYTVRVVGSTLPSGLAPTFDFDGVASVDSAALSLAASAHRTDVDFGYRGTASLGDRLWVDSNANGAQESGEAGLNGVSVRLLDGDGNVVATTTTAGDGHYSFSNLPAGIFTVAVDAASLPAGTVPTFDRDGLGTVNTATVNLSGGEHLTDVDFGYRGTASLGDRVWYDVDGDGVQDAGEPGLNGVTVQLVDGGGNVIASATTSGNGDYSFGNLMAGTYIVRTVAASLPAGAVATFDVDGAGTVNTATLNLAGGVNRTDVDFGYRGNSSLGDRVWYDVNGNGAQDTYEAGLNGITVQLVDGGGNVIASTLTAGDGAYSFSGLLAGTYTVRTVLANLPADAAPTFDADGIATPDNATVILATGQSRTDVDFGYNGTGALGDIVWYDLNGNGIQETGEVGLNGVTVELLDGNGNVVNTAVTSGNGGYSFAGLFPGTYSVRIVISTLPGGAVETFDLDGTGTADIATATVANGQNLTTVDFGYRGTASVGDRIWLDLSNNSLQDSGEPGINGVAVELLDASGNVLASTTTSSAGIYGFTNLLAGSYSVRVVASTLPPGLNQTYDLDGTGTANSASLSLTTGEARADVDFGYRGSLQFGDRVWFDYDGDGVQDTGEPGLASVTIELRNSSGALVATTITGANGLYSFYNLPPGTYTVTVVASTLPAGAIATYDLDGAASANTAAVTLMTGQNRTDVDFGYRGTASLGDRVWLDYDGDGAQDAGEVGINGATVQLLDSAGTVIATTATAGDGNYSFPNLLAGTYKVKVIAPAGMTQTYDLDGMATPGIATAAVSAGQSRTDVDFGYRKTAPGTGTLGYWKTHAEAWPVATITIGGRVYTKDQAITLLGTPSRGDKSIDLFKQLVAAKLNLIEGNNPSCIYQTINSADAWMATYPPGSNVSAGSAAWITASPWHTTLDNYNNGQLCAPHRN
jgi:hypothetical protein